MTQHRITDDLDALLNVLPKTIVTAVHKANDYDRLLEIILDLGRIPTARYVDREVALSEKEITRAELDYVVEHIGETAPPNILRKLLQASGGTVDKGPDLLPVLKSTARVAQGIRQIHHRLREIIFALVDETGRLLPG